ncbi:MAG TPA: ribonuclease E/G [Stellaceae bacterium]|nr:ribonuclease E/G [Stellaceae bacterium]
MSRTLLISVSPGEVRGALVAEGRLVELRVERLGQGSRIGEIHLGRVLRLLPALPAALVDLGLDRPAFLSEEDARDAATPETAARGIAAWLQEGRTLLVQVKRDAQGEKAAGLTLRLRLSGRLLALTPTRPRLSYPRGCPAEEQARLAGLVQGALPPEEGVAFGRAAIGAADEAVRAELARLRGQWARIRETAARASPPALLAEAMSPLARLLDAVAEDPPDRYVIDDRAGFAEARSWLARIGPELAARLELDQGSGELFDRHGVGEAVEAATAPRVSLPGGRGALRIEETAAMTVIDVDSSQAGADRGSSRQAILEVNRAAAAEAARQIRLRNLSGAIVIDFISMPRRADREAVAAALADALAGDPAAPQLLGWTRLGHIELARRRRHPPLAEILGERLPGGGWRQSALTTALAALRAARRQAEAAPGRGVAMELHPEVAAALDGPAAAARRTLEARLPRPLQIRADPALPRDGFAIRPADPI